MTIAVVVDPPRRDRKRLRKKGNGGNSLESIPPNQSYDSTEIVVQSRFLGTKGLSLDKNTKDQ